MPASIDQIRVGPTYPVPDQNAIPPSNVVDISDSEDFSDGEDTSDVEVGAEHPLAILGARNKKKAYCVFYGRSTGVFLTWSSTEFQTKFFSGASHQGYRSQEEAIAAWDYAVSTNVIGPPSANTHRRRRGASQPSTPRRHKTSMPLQAHRAATSSTSRIRNAAPILPMHSPITSMPSTPVRPIVRAAGLAPFPPSSVSTMSSATPSSPSSVSTSTSSSGIGRSPGSSAPASRGSASRLAAIETVMQKLDLGPHYVVLVGKKPGVYASQTSALSAAGDDPRNVCRLVASKELANSLFVTKYEAGEVERL
ncbi:hypothetical protein BDZ97DRAFT_1760056 [Flammula alnicola]|nr:hypothetical protein BDZ97DRAFT_1760056 [Flammula alnicola]